MRALFLATYTDDCEKNWLSWAACGHDYVVERYDDRPHDRHDELVARARAERPDVIVFIGAIERYHQRPVPSADVLCQLREVAPTVHICGDGRDEPWWEWLSLYDARGCFNVQVSIDGSFETPIAEFKRGLVRLTPTDPSAFVLTPWEARTVALGHAGGQGHGERAALLSGLESRALLTRLPYGASYAEMCRFLGNCKLTVNSPMTGSGNGEHVKGRVLEAGWAGACLLEKAGSPTERWFSPGVDYLAYSGLEDLIEKVVSLGSRGTVYAGMAARLAARVRAEHHPALFWEEVLKFC